jgi:hypothetical protein
MRILAKLRLCASLLLAIGIAVPGAAFTIDETIDGDLSNDGLTPTLLVPSLGANDLAMTSGSPAGVVDRDYFRIDIALGQVLDSILLTAASVDGAVSFIGVQSGPVMTEPPIGTNVANLLGWHHFGSGDVGTDILAAIATGAGSQGFVPPLGPGSYTFWAQDFGFQASYLMRFHLSQVPEPRTVVLQLIGLVALGHAGLRRQSATSNASRSGDALLLEGTRIG